jgi:DNA-binding SARP family transcriptional activator
VLGPLEVRRGGAPLAIGGPKQRALLTALLLRANEVVPRHRLIDDLWAERPPEAAAKALQVYVSRLRNMLAFGAEEILQTAGSGYRVIVESAQFDFAEFQRLVTAARTAGRSGCPELSSTHLKDALALWRGPALADLAGEPIADQHAPRLNELRVDALEELIDVELKLGRHAGVLHELQQLVVLHPFRERFRAQLMLALYRRGNQAAALREYRRARREFNESLGLEPSPSLKRLERSILRHEPAIGGPPEDRPQRKFSNVKRVTVLQAMLTADAGDDSERLHRLTRTFIAALTEAVAKHGGRAEISPGGGAVAWFGVDEVHEDDALRAARAALSLRRELARLGAAKRAVRIGIETGVVVAGEGTDRRLGAAIGQPVAVAARLQQVAPAGAIAVGREAQRALGCAVETLPLDLPRTAARELGEVRRLECIRPDAGTPLLDTDVPLMGRTRELAYLQASFNRVASGGTTELVLVVGEAGIGKSRLVATFCALLPGETCVFRGRCLSYGDGVTFFPIAQLVEAAVGADVATGVRGLIDEPDAAAVAERIALLVGRADANGDAALAVSALRRLIDALGSGSPVIVVLDDLQWAEDPLLDLIERLRAISGGPLLIVGLSRPELLDRRPRWFERGSSLITLTPLDRTETEMLFDALVGSEPIPAHVRKRTVERSDGNPLFLEQTALNLVEAGENDPPLPPTVYGVIAVRLDRLPKPQQEVLQYASIIGRDFSTDQLRPLVPPAVEHTEGVLAELAAKGLIRFPEKEGSDFQFAHILVRDVVYESLTKESRARLHEQLATWVEQERPTMAADHPAFLAHHLDLALRYRIELGLDEDLDRLKDRAAPILAAAGRRAYTAGDAAAAAKLLGRALELMPSESGNWAEAALEHGEILREVGEFARSEQLLDRAIDSAASTGQVRLASRAQLEKFRTRMRREPPVTAAKIRNETQRVIGSLAEGAGNDATLALAWWLFAWAPWTKGRVGEAEEALTRALAYARSAGDLRMQERATNLLLGASILGPTPVAWAAARSEHVLATAEPGSRMAADAIRALSWLRALEGRSIEARELVAQDKSMLLELGLAVSVAAAAEVYGHVELALGDPAAAEREFRAGCATLEKMGETHVLPELRAGLALALLDAGRPDEAEAIAIELLQSAQTDEVTLQTNPRLVQATVAAQRGEAVVARRFAYKAVDVVARTEYLKMHGEAQLTLGRVLALLGDSRADAELGEACALLERKGNRVYAQRADRLRRRVLAERTRESA